MVSINNSLYVLRVNGLQMEQNTFQEADQEGAQSPWIGSLLTLSLVSKPSFQSQALGDSVTV